MNLDVPEEMLKICPNAHSVAVGNLTYQIWVWFGDLGSVAKYLRDLRKGCMHSLSLSAGKIEGQTHPSIYLGTLEPILFWSQALTSLTGPCGQEILRVHIWSKPYPAIAQAPHFSSARRCTIGPTVLMIAGLPQPKPHLICLSATKMIN